MNRQRSVEVVADWVDLGGPTVVGQLTTTPARGKEVFAFEYDKDWLSRAPRQQLDPTMGLYRGPQYPAKSRDNFGVFLDSSPDRWGRVLMRRREAQLARAEGRAERRLLEFDYLLGVHDGHGMALFVSERASDSLTTKMNSPLHRGRRCGNSSTRVYSLNGKGSKTTPTIAAGLEC